MSDTDSDESINTDDLNEIIEIKKQDTAGGVERSSEKKVKVKKEVEEVKDEEVKKEKIKPQKREPKARTAAQIAATERLIASNKAKREAKGKVVVVDGKEDIKEETDIDGNEVTVKKKRVGRPKTHTKEVVTKEKVIYMVQDGNGNFVESKPPKPLTKAELKKIENEKKSKQDEVELGRKLIRKKNGTTDLRSKNTRTPAQIEASKRLVELNKKRREDRLKAQKEQLSETIKDVVTDTVVDVVTKPIAQVKEERKVNRKIITDEERKAHEFKKLKNLFS